MFIVQEYGHQVETGHRIRGRKQAVKFAQAAAKKLKVDVYVWDSTVKRIILRIRKPRFVSWV
jgi:hypothetical protein